MARADYFTEINVGLRVGGVAAPIDPANITTASSLSGIDASHDAQ